MNVLTLLSLDPEAPMRVIHTITATPAFTTLVSEVSKRVADGTDLLQEDDSNMDLA